MDTPVSWYEIPDKGGGRQRAPIHHRISDPVTVAGSRSVHAYFLYPFQSSRRCMHTDPR